MKDSLRAAPAAIDFSRPRGAVGDAAGYLFPIGGGDCIGFGDRNFHVSLLDRQSANGIVIVIVNHYSGRVYVPPRSISASG